MINGKSLSFKDNGFYNTLIDLLHERHHKNIKGLLPSPSHKKKSRQQVLKAVTGNGCCAD